MDWDDFWIGFWITVVAVALILAFALGGTAASTRGYRERRANIAACKTIADPQILANCLDHVHG